MEYEVAKIEDYGYKNHNIIKKVWKTASTIIFFLTVLIMYSSIFIILLQSFNASENPSEFTGFTFKWYGLITSNRSLWSAIKNTFITSISATAIATILGTLIAVGIYSLSKRSKKGIMLLNNIPMLNADIVTGVQLMILFSIVSRFLPYFFGVTTLLIAHVYFTLPYVILSVLPKLKEVDQNMFDASTDLGLKPYSTLRKVVIPAIKSGVFAGMILAFTMSFDDFVISYYTTGNGFDTLSIWIYSSIGRKSLTPAVYAFSSLVTIASFAFIIGLNIYRNRMETRHVKKK